MRISAGSLLSVLFVVSAITLWAANVLGTTVVLVEPVKPAPGMKGALARIKGELLSTGFAVEIVDDSTVETNNAETRNWLEQLAVRRGADAVLAVMGNESPNSIEIWVIDKVTGKSVVRRISFQPSSARGSATLAIQSVELLRASFLEIDLSASESRREDKPVPPEVIRFVEAAPTAKRMRRAALELGGAVSAGGAGTSVMPFARAFWLAHPWLVIQAMGAVLGSRTSVERAAGKATMAQAFALLGAGYRFNFGSYFTPFVSLSAGALHTAVEGRASLPLEGHHADQWSLLLNGELGATVALPERLYLSLSEHAQVAEPHPVIRFEGVVAAKSAYPNLLTTLTMGAWF